MKTTFYLVAAALLLTATWVHAQDPLPWEVWEDLSELARLRLDHQVVMSSSRSPDGGAYDRHSDGDSRFIRTVGDEGVIFEATGAGAITRIWMTQGDGVSQPLDPAIRVRITLDGTAEPVVDLPLPDLFGAVAPFEPPLAVDRTVSSGGNTSYVPIPFRDGCRLSLVGAETATIWYQVTGHRLASAGGVETFTGNEDLTAWRTWLDDPGQDPWPDGASHPVVAGAAVLAPGATEVLVAFTGPDSLTGLLLDVPRASWSDVVLLLDFDGLRRTELALDDFFAVGRAAADSTRALLIGADAQNGLYSYFPMPFFRFATVSLRLAGDALEPVEVGYEVRRRGLAPAGDSGYFGAELEVIERSTAGHDSIIADVDGPGRWVGLFLEAGSVGSQSKTFLEGDERIHLDVSPHPALYGTGVEDFFGGGFYYRVDGTASVPFRRALHGMTYELADAVGFTMGMYRLMLTDAPVFGQRLVVGLEGGAVNQTPVRYRAVSYTYTRPTPPVRRRDLLDLGDPVSRLAHLYTAGGDPACGDLSALFEDEPPTELVAERCGRGEGRASFVLRGAGRGQALVLRRRFDDREGDQRAELWVGGQPGPSLGYEGANPHRRWRERDTLLGSWNEPTGGVEIWVDAPPIAPPALDGFTESAWELWAGFPPGTCDTVLDGWCDAADVADGVRAVDGGAPVEDLELTLAATFD